MATATAKVESVMTSVRLTLSKEEAELLRDIMGSITGSAAGSRRSLSDSIYRALNDITGLGDFYGDDIDRWLHFKDKS